MSKFTGILLLCALLAFAAFAKGPEVTTSPTVSSFGSVDPNLSYNVQDVVVWANGGTAPTIFGRAGGGIIGNYMYQFGSEAANCAQAYNLTTNAWEVSTPATQGWDNWGSATTNNATYLIGGYTGSVAFNNVQKFVPSGGGPSGTWTQMAIYPETLLGIAAAWDGGNYIYAAGGTTVTGTSMATAYKYDIGANTWTAIASMPGANCFCGAGFVAGKFYVLGGTVLGGNQLYEYNPGSNSWTTKAPVPTPVWFGTSSTTFNNSYLLSVGGGGGYASWPATNAVQIYNPATDTWTQETPLPVARGTNMARWAGSGKVVSGGGYAGGYSGVTYVGTGFPGGAPALAPAAPSNFFASNNGPTLTASLIWTNPTLTVDGHPLASIDKVYIKRNDVLIDSLNGTPGQNMSYNNNVPAVGNYGYQVFCSNAAGNGEPANASAWIGLDTPGAPTGVVATPGDMSYTLNWVAPTTSQHGGYWPPGSWTGQKIYRNGTLVATLTGSNTSYNGTVPAAGNYTIGVAYYNTSGDGPTTNAAPVFIAGPPQYTMTTTPYAWVEINPQYPGALRGINTGLNSDDQNLGPFNIGFSFPSWSGTSFTSVRMCSNGWASFTSTVTTYINVTIPTAAEPNNLLAVYWDDQNLSPTAGGGKAFYYTDLPNNRFIMEWDSVPHYGYVGSYFTYEIILHTDGTIDYMYKVFVPGGTTPYPSATIGIEDATGALGMLATFDGSGPINPTNQSGIRFAPIGGGASLDVTMTPVSPPIQIPRAGGSFSFSISIEQLGTMAPYAVWARIKNPDGSYTGPVLGPVTVNTPTGVVITRTRNQTVPGSWAAGSYQQIGYVNPTFAYPATDSSAFGWVKLTVADGSPEVFDAVCSGELFPGEVGIAAPASFSLIGATPNPFNPITTISFTLPEASRVTLNVFDVSGRQVAQLVNGLRAAGAHQVSFDGSNLSSGVYLYTLTAGSQTATGKMVLLK